jgi:hypothetical protein
VGTKTITMYVSDLDQSEIPVGQAYQLSIRHPDGSTQQLDISEKNYRDLKLAGVGKTLKKRGRKPGSTTAADSTPAQAWAAPEPQTGRPSLTQISYCIYAPGSQPRIGSSVAYPGDQLLSMERI